jgi:hypothetical protein
MRMSTVKPELSRFERLKDLKPLLSTEGPCLSVYMPLGTDRQNEIRWKDCLGNLDARAPQFGAAAAELVDSVRDWKSVDPGLREPGSSKSIAVFRSPDVFQITTEDGEIPARALLGPHFYVRPLVSLLARERAFYLLGLSQKNTRMLLCDMHTSKEIPFPPGIQTSFEIWMNQAKPDHNLIYNAMTSGAQGTVGPSALAPQGGDDKAKDEYLSHFFKQINKGVNDVLKGKTEPLVLCAVEYEIPIYRGVNSYPHLADEEVHGAPNSLKSGEMHARAIEALERSYASKIDAVLADWNHRVGAGASSRLKEVVTAAHDGRVLTLLVSDSMEKTGVFDEPTHRVKGAETGGTGDEDLVNDAAVQTILHAGEVLVAPHNKLPNGSPLAAIFRY